jgi:hypothetical protein
MSLKSGFRAYKSESIDYFLEHHDQFPLTVVLFYDSGLMNENIVRSLTLKILDVFVYKYEKKFLKGNFNIRSSSTGPGQNNHSFETALSLIYEDSLVEWVKMLFIELNSQNILTPWIYLFYNNDFLNVSALLYSNAYR